MRMLWDEIRHMANWWTFGWLIGTGVGVFLAAAGASVWVTLLPVVVWFLVLMARVWRG